MLIIIQYKQKLFKILLQIKTFVIISSIFAKSFEYSIFLHH